MGVFKKFIGGIACECLQAGLRVGSDYKIQTINYKTIYGDSRNVVHFGSGENIAFSFSPYANLIPVATADDIADYNLFDYRATSIGSVSTSKKSTIKTTSARMAYTICISNAENSDIIVKCIKLTKPVQGLSTAYNPDTVLVGAYYLDSPLTIPAGDSRTITIEIVVGTDVSVNET